MYLAVLTWLPGAPSLLHPPAAQKLLEALGTWHPHVVKSMLPVLVALVLVSQPCLALYNVTLYLLCPSFAQLLHVSRLQIQLQQCNSMQLVE